jgi:hypothetical protein
MGSGKGRSIYEEDVDASDKLRDNGTGWDGVWVLEFRTDWSTHDIILIVILTFQML